jgi:hypothetical protein
MMLAKWGTAEEKMATLFHLSSLSFETFFRYPIFARSVFLSTDTSSPKSQIRRKSQLIFTLSSEQFETAHFLKKEKAIMSGKLCVPK